MASAAGMAGAGGTAMAGASAAGCCRPGAKLTLDASKAGLAKGVGVVACIAKAFCGVAASWPLAIESSTCSISSCGSAPS